MTQSFNELYLHELALLASAEQQMMNLLPKLSAGTDTPELQRASNSRRTVVQNSASMCLNS